MHFRSSRADRLLLFSFHFTLQAMVVRTIRTDTVFIPYHWPGGRSANRLTHRTASGKETKW